MKPLKLTFKKAEALHLAITTLIGAPLGLFLGKVTNNALNLSPSTWNEIPGGVVFIIILIITYKLAKHGILMTCPNKGCNNIITRTSKAIPHKKSIEVTYKIRYNCKKCGIIKREDYTQIYGE
jgi:hypothetical protein